MKFLPAGEKVGISNFISSFCLKDIVWAENLYSSFLSWEGKAVQSFSKIWIVVSDSAYQKIVEFLPAGEKSKILNFITWFCLKDKLLKQKIYKAVSCSEGRAMQSFNKIWIVVSNSAYQKIVKFLRAGEKSKISNFISLFCLKNKVLEQKIYTAVSCSEREGLCKV